MLARHLSEPVRVEFAAFCKIALMGAITDHETALRAALGAVYHQETVHETVDGFVDDAALLYLDEGGGRLKVHYYFDFSSPGPSPGEGAPVPSPLTAPIPRPGDHHHAHPGGAA